MLLLLSVLNTLSSIQDFGVSDGVERVNFGGAMTLPENGFFNGDIWFIVPGIPMFPVLRWSLPCIAPHDILPVPQPLFWWLLQGDCFRRGWRKHIYLNYRHLKGLRFRVKFYTWAKNLWSLKSKIVKFRKRKMIFTCQFHTLYSKTNESNIPVWGELCYPII